MCLKKFYYICVMNEFIRTLEKYYEDGLLYKQTHPTLPLTIWNYTPQVQYTDIWDTITLQCRGLVTDDNGNVVARPLKKFFNIEEGKHTPTSEFEIYEKMDGSLGIMFEYNGQMVCATRGSFTSDQSKWMTNFAIKNNYQNLIVSGSTYLFEIIYPENRIVVDYQGQERLVLLGIINAETGEEVPYEDIFEKFDIVKRYDGIKDYTKLKSLIDNNAEGFVIRFSNGDRMKIKGEEYLRLHKIMTNVSTTGIWEMLSNGDNVNELLKDVPDEFYKKIQNYVRDLKYNYVQISEMAGKLHDGFRYGKYNDVDPEPTKKEFAEFVFKQQKVLHPVMFAMWDKKKYDKIIWNILKPEFEKL
jgi:T4 RnlA family RNA ligase